MADDPPASTGSAHPEPPPSPGRVAKRALGAEAGEVEVSPTKRRAATTTATPPLSTSFRLLVPPSRIGALLGPGGSVIARLRTTTGARIRVGPPTLCGGGGGGATAADGWAGARVVTLSSEGATNEPGGDPPTPSSACPASTALLAAYDAAGGVGDAAQPDADTSARLLVHQSQVGALLGRGGAIAAELRASTGAGLRVLPHCDAACAAAGPADAVVALSGRPAAVRAGLAAVAARLRAYPPKAGPAWGGGGGALPPVPAVSAVRTPRSPLSSAGASPTLAAALAAAGAPDGFGGLGARGPAAAAAARPFSHPGWAVTAAASPTASQATGAPAPPSASYRLLVPARGVGALLGVGGRTVSAVRAATGARVVVHPPTPAPDRVIQFWSAADGGPASPTAGWAVPPPLPSAAAALVACADILIADPSSSTAGGGGGAHGRVAVRLLASGPAARSALGVRGCLAAAVRAETGAAVRAAALPAGGGQAAPLPATAVDGDVVLSVEGSARSVAAGVRLVAALLRGGEGGRGGSSSAATTPTHGAGHGHHHPAASAAASHHHQPVSPVSPASPGSASWGVPASLPRLQTKAAGGPPKSRLGAAASPSHAATLRLTPPQAGVLLGRGGVALAQLRSVTGATATVGGGGPPASPSSSACLRLAGSPAQVSAAAAMVQALLMAAGVAGEDAGAAPAAATAAAAV